MRQRGKQVKEDGGAGGKPSADHAEKRMKPMMLTVLLGGAALVLVRETTRGVGGLYLRTSRITLLRCTIGGGAPIKADASRIRKHTHAHAHTRAHTYVQ